MQRITFYVNVVLGILVVGTLVLALPYIASAVFLYEGELSLGRALAAQGVERSNWDVNRALATGTALPGAAAGDVAQAAAHLGRAVGWDKNNAQAYHSLAGAYVLQQNYQAAADTLAGFGRVQPLSRSDTILLGTLYARAGDTAKALETWRKTGLTMADDAAMWTVKTSLRPDVTAFTIDPGDAASVGVIDQRRVVGMYNVATLGTLLFFPEAGDFRVRLRALNSTPPPVQLDIQIDQTTLSSLFYGAGDGTWGEQEARVRVDAGWHWFGIKFANDYFSPPYDRNAFVESVEITRAQ